MGKRICEQCKQPSNPQRGMVLRHSNAILQGEYHGQCYSAAWAALEVAEHFEELPGSWPMLFAEVRKDITPEKLTAFLSLYRAVKVLIDVCPDDNAQQLAARRGGTLLSDAVSANEAVQMLRASALVELLAEAQKEKSSVSAYMRMNKALRTLGFDSERAVNLALYFLGYHTREGKPMEWLTKKFNERKRRK